MNINKVAKVIQVVVDFLFDTLILLSEIPFIGVPFYWLSCKITAGVQKFVNWYCADEYRRIRLIAAIRNQQNERPDDP